MSEALDCAFCSPAELEPRRLSDPANRFILSFLSVPRMTRGHALVIPRRHVVPGEDRLSSEEIIALDNEVERLRKAMLGSIALGVDVFQKTRPSVAQGHKGTKMNHLHYHVLPSNPGDELYEEGVSWGIEGNFALPGDGEVEEMIEILRDK